MFDSWGYFILLIAHVLNIGTPAPHCSTQPVVKTVDEIPKKYYFSNKLANFKDAIEQCKDMKMELVSILTADQQEEIGEEMIKQKLTAHYWTSGHRNSRSKPWVWLSDDRITKFFWDKGEPNNAKKNEFCIETFYNNKKKKNVWNDIPCSTKRRFICMLTKSLETVTPDTVPNTEVTIEGNAGVNAQVDVDGETDIRSDPEEPTTKFQQSENY